MPKSKTQEEKNKETRETIRTNMRAALYSGGVALFGTGSAVYHACQGNWFGLSISAMVTLGSFVVAHGSVEKVIEILTDLGIKNIKGEKSEKTV